MGRGKNEVICLRSHNESGEPPALTPTMTRANVSVTLRWQPRWSLSDCEPLLWARRLQMAPQGRLSVKAQASEENCPGGRTGICSILHLEAKCFISLI